MRYLPKLQQLKVFQQVIRSGSIRGAARALGQSQPAVSRTLRELEQTLETRLIVRGNQGMTLTETGRAFS
ncbi:LysR family transcriptional regulator [Lelliottia amnigena]